MFSGRMISKYTKNFSAETSKLKERLQSADSVLIGAGAGLSAAAGFTYSGERFKKNFPDFIEKYGFGDMYSADFYPFGTPEEQWAYRSRYIFINRYRDEENGVYRQLLELVRDKDYFVLTTNVDHLFQKAGFDKKRLFYTQGDYGLFQCSEPCCHETFDNEKTIREMVSEQKNMRVPTELLPKCPKCGKPLTTNLRADEKFVQDDGWYAANDRYADFLRRHKNSDIILLELGVGFNTPSIIKFPFWKMTAENPNAFYACVNFGEALFPAEIENRAICLDSDICKVIGSLSRRQCSTTM